ncbi:VCBS repeat-containing protein [bacterium]|nr:VCBS repeat-containing protein [bacterium]
MKHIFIIQWILLFIIVPPCIKQSLAQAGGDLIWKNSADWYVNTVSPAEDVNGDGISDIFVGSDDKRVYCYSGADGSIIWSWAFGNPVLITKNFINVNDYHDNVKDCLVGIANDRVACMSGIRETEMLWSCITNVNVSSIATIEDVDGDGMADCLVGTANDSVHCLNGHYGYKIWSYQALSDVRTVQSIDDVNGDGKQDCIAGGDGDRILCISGGSGGTGELIWSYQTTGTIFSVAPIADVDGDGICDCLAGSQDDWIYCISGATGRYIWGRKTGSTVRSVSAFADVNNDGIADCIAGGEDNFIYCLSGSDGSHIWSFNTGSTVLNVSTIHDVNGTGGEDCIAGSDGDIIYCIEGKSRETGEVLWSYSAGGRINSVISIPDLNGNGIDDVVAGSNDSYIYAIEGGTYIPPAETVSTPTTLTGPSCGMVGQSLSFSTDGSVSSLGHPVEYRFDWNDGNISGWGKGQQNHFWNSASSYSIRSQAKSTANPSVTSEWSQAWVILINQTGIGAIETDDLPDRFRLVQNFPNPFNAETWITLQLPHSAQIDVDIFNIHGAHIATLASGSKPAGTFKLHWDGRNDTGDPVPSGFYIYKLYTGNSTFVKRMLLLK